MSRNRFAAVVTVSGGALLALSAFLAWVNVYALGVTRIGGLEFAGGEAFILLGLALVVLFQTGRVYRLGVSSRSAIQQLHF